MSDENNLNKDISARHESESRFHDQKYGQGTGYPRHYSVNPTYPVYQQMLRMAGDISGKSVLEYGCGEGWITHDLARMGAVVSAFDISAEAVRKTREVLVTDGYEGKCSIEQMGAEKLIYPDNSFDTVVGFAIIHHLDLDLAFPELYRVLKPGGIALFAEPLGTNPLINLYRRLTPQYRTKDEEPLNLKALSPLLAHFKHVEHKDFYLTALAAVALSYLPMGAKLYPPVNRGLMKLDDGLLRVFPSLGHFAWYTVLKLEK